LPGSWCLKVQALEQWQANQPDMFNKRVFELAGLDKQACNW
jgi:hypothetical protein